MSEYLSPYDREQLWVVVAGQHRRVPREAAPWVSCVLAPTGVTSLVVGLGDDPWGAWLISGIADGTIPLEEVKTTAYTLLGDVSPYKWWKTARLLALSSREDIAGHLTLAGLDPWNLTVAQWVTAVYTLLTKNADAKAKFKIDAPLDDPPAGVVDDDWMSEESFAAMVAQARNAPGQK